MPLECFIWIQHCWNERFKKFLNRKEGKFQHLPDSIIVEILSRLPSEQLSNCQLVCRKFRDLTSTPYFREIHSVKRASPIVLVQYFNPGIHDKDMQVYLLDEKTKDENQKLNCTGRFFIPSDDEQWRSLCTFLYKPNYQVPPVIANGFLYWIASYKRTADADYASICKASIVAFNIDTEEFKIMAHPGNLCSLPRIEHSQSKMQLVRIESDDNLLFCRLNEKDYIKIWVLQDSANWIWVEKYNVDLKWDLRIYQFFDHAGPDNDIRLVNIQDGELLLFWSNRGLFRYPFLRKTMREIKRTIAGKEISNLTTENFLS
ncbi:hypothetical protein JCGZ_23419 [Jatropha curcas]|uniref:F-box domain-containing protein n=1 Tax=Jatropha curcas TaxID=180498 RepID=A0A067JI10_JATCU|nr:hypothetical protein JCGZ_23419 [Jatropha curcas]